MTGARIALLDPACVVKLADWLPVEMAQKFATPDFNVSWLSGGS